MLSEAVYLVMLGAQASRPSYRAEGKTKNTRKVASVSRPLAKLAETLVRKPWRSGPKALATEEKVESSVDRALVIITLREREA
jgi:hypothetical protein